MMLYPIPSPLSRAFPSARVRRIHARMPSRHTHATEREQTPQLSRETLLASNELREVRCFVVPHRGASWVRFARAAPDMKGATRRDNSLITYRHGIHNCRVGARPLKARPPTSSGCISLLNALLKQSSCTSLSAFPHVRNRFCTWIESKPCCPPLREGKRT